MDLKNSYFQTMDDLVQWMLLVYESKNGLEYSIIEKLMALSVDLDSALGRAEVAERERDAAIKRAEAAEREAERLRVAISKFTYKHSVPIRVMYMTAKGFQSRPCLCDGCQEMRVALDGSGGQREE